MSQTSEEVAKQPEVVGDVLATLPESFSVTNVGNSLYSTIPKTVRDVHEIEDVETINITVTSEGWFVKPVEGGDD